MLAPNDAPMDLIVLEDEHLLVVNKPAGWNTHSPSPFAGEGLYEWLRQREPRWENLSTLHRLDKETSGLIVFGKTSAANCALARQFEEGQVRKKYLFLTEGPLPVREIKVRSDRSTSAARLMPARWWPKRSFNRRDRWLKLARSPAKRTKSGPRRPPKVFRFSATHFMVGLLMRAFACTRRNCNSNIP